MTKWVILTTIAVLTVLAACGGGSDERVDAKGTIEDGDASRGVAIAASASAAPAPAPVFAVDLVAPAAAAVPESAQFESSGFESAGAAPGGDLPFPGR